MKYLYKYTVEEFINFTEEQGLTNWWIYNQTPEKRYEVIQNSIYTETLKKFAKNNINYSNEELVSWIDNIQMIYSSLDCASEIINKNKLSLEILKRIQIIAEYHIPYSNQRSDILMIKDNKILIIELSYKKENMNRKDKYQEKLNQVMNYKELLENALPKHIEIATYSFPIETETDVYGNPIKVKSIYINKKTHKNFDSCYYLARFIIKFFQNTNKSALEELELLNDDFIEYNFKDKKFENKY